MWYIHTADDYSALKGRKNKQKEKEINKNKKEGHSDTCYSIDEP